MLSGIQATRIRLLKPLPLKKQKPYVLYWMQQAQRTVFNHALEYAVSAANDLKLPLIVIFGLTRQYPEACARHYSFMLEGLKEARSSLAERGILLKIVQNSPPLAALEMARDAALIVCDRGYLRHQRLWRRQLAESAPCRVVQVDSDTVNPAEVVSTRAEYAARTIRPKIHKHLESYLVPIKQMDARISSLGKFCPGIKLDSVTRILDSLDLTHGPGPVTRWFPGGEKTAMETFSDFLDHKIHRYKENHNQPQAGDVSHMGPYLHFGQISALQMALMTRKALGESQAGEAFLEQLIVRRELAVNHVLNRPDYDSWSSLPNWCRETLDDHKADFRDHVYSRDQLIKAQTHDPFWNAAMEEMAHTGYMHNHMRMYWGKKILEWSPTPMDAFETCLTLNNRYFLDGRDPNSYAGVAWVFGLHDRPWKERTVFGKVRYMNAAGLKRKCRIKDYVERVKKKISFVEK